MTSSYVDVNPAVDPQAGSFQLALAKRAKLTSPAAVIDGVLKNVVTVASIKSALRDLACPRVGQRLRQP